MAITRVLRSRMLFAGLVLAGLATSSEAGKPAIPAQKAIDGLPVPDRQTAFEFSKHE